MQTDTLGILYITCISFVLFDFLVCFVLFFCNFIYFFFFLIFCVFFLNKVVEGRNLKYKGKPLSSNYTYAIVEPPVPDVTPLSSSSSSKEQIKSSCQKGSSPRWDHTFVVYAQFLPVSAALMKLDTSQKALNK